MLSAKLYNVYLLILLAIVILATIRYKRYDNSSQLVYFIILAALINEATVNVLDILDVSSMPAYHVYAPLDFILVSIFFLKITGIKLSALKYLLIISGIAGVSIINSIFFQTLLFINSNIFALESFVIILLALYSLFVFIMNDEIVVIHSSINFWYAIVFLVLYGGTFFFWTFIAIFDKDLRLREIAQCTQLVINMIAYIGIFAVLYLYPNKIAR